MESMTRSFLRSSKNKGLPSKRELLKVYHNLLRQNKLKRNEKLEKLLVKRAVRTLSGVTIVTVLSKPYACPGKCVYCPSEKNMPKSYIADEPAAARALMLGFDPYIQVKSRLEALKESGHPIDKVELIVKGGSWNHYPLNYQYRFILRCFQACNRSQQEISLNTKIELLKSQLFKAQSKNEKAKSRIIGLTLETRPDLINEKTVKTMRELGCTRIELGAQSSDDKILKLINRGHGTEETKKATALLRAYGYKIDYHLMPQLPLSTPLKDLKMMRTIFDDQSFRPDMIKIYPCTVVKNSELYKWFKQKKYKPYSDKKLIEILTEFKSNLPRYVRISRLIRDIPSHHIVAGNKTTNLRQVIAEELKKRGQSCPCLRCREVGHKPEYINEKPFLFIDEYEASNGREYFLSFEDKNRQAVFAFCRLRIDERGIYPAFIRELHTYGQLVEISGRAKNASQHKGLGKKLLEEAEKICKSKKISKLAIISGVGVRDYYRKLGYRLEKGYMVKKN